MPTRYDVTRDDLAKRLSGLPRYRVDQVWQGLYQQLIGPEEMTTLPVSLRAELTDYLPLALTPIAESQSDNGTTIKWLWGLDGDARVETVLMLYADRATVCVSSQAGCAMGCGFCATGQAGFDRHLSTGEIVEQVVRATQRARTLGRRVSNVVFMGMGEPLANYDRTWEATLRLHDDLGLSARHLTISTVGITPGIRRMATESLPVNLAVSLHAANDALRDELVPINRRYPLEDITAACAVWIAGAQSASVVRVGIDRRDQRSPCGREPARRDRTTAPRAREPDPVEPDTRVADTRHTAGTRARVQRSTEGPGCERDRACQSRHRDRRSMRTACCGGQPTCDARPAQ